MTEMKPPQIGENNHAAKLTDAQALEMRYLRQFAGLPYAELGKIFGVTTSNAFYVCTGQTFRHLGNVQPRVYRSRRASEAPTLRIVR